MTRVGMLGTSGLVGRHLAAALRARGDEVVPASLRDPAAAAHVLAETDVVVNLAGESIAQRWSSDVKQRIRSSRVEAPGVFLETLASAPQRPRAYVSASAIGYYGMSEDETFTEASKPGSDFLAGICVAWEQEAAIARDLEMRMAIVRTGIVLAADGGVLERLLPIFKNGGGGPVASGRQWYSWVHIDDLVGIYLAAIERLDGIFNATSPNPVRNAEFTETLGRAVHRPAVIPVPEFALNLMLGEAAVIATRGQRVLPERTLAQGYVFQYPELARAFARIIGS